AGITGQVQRATDPGPREPTQHACLVHGDGSVQTVLEHDHRDGRTHAYGRLQLLAGHHRTAVPDHRHHGAFGTGDLGRHRGGYRITHGPAGGCQLRVRVPKPPSTVQEGGEVARVIGQ